MSHEESYSLEDLREELRRCRRGAAIARMLWRLANPFSEPPQLASDREMLGELEQRVQRVLPALAPEERTEADLELSSDRGAAVAASAGLPQKEVHELLALCPTIMQTMLSRRKLIRNINLLMTGYLSLVALILLIAAGVFWYVLQ